MDKFYALAEPRRRRIMELLADNGQMSATEISNKFDITAQAVSQHLKILHETHLIEMQKKAQQRIYRINPTSMREMERWIRNTTTEWNERFDRLDEILKRSSSKNAQN